VGLEWGALSLVSTIEELLRRKSSGSGGIRHTDHVAPLSAKVGTNFAEKRSLLSVFHSRIQALFFVCVAV
jgi:hypothetical protein